MLECYNSTTSNKVVLPFWMEMAMEFVVNVSMEWLSRNIRSTIHPALVPPSAIVPHKLLAFGDRNFVSEMLLYVAQGQPVDSVNFE